MANYTDVWNDWQNDPTAAGPTGVPDPTNPGFDTGGYPLSTSAPPPAPPVGGGAWAPGTPQANGVTPTFTPAPGSQQTPVTNGAGQIWGAGGQNGNVDTTGAPMSFGKAAAKTTPDAAAGAGVLDGVLAPFTERAPDFPAMDRFTPLQFKAPSIQEAYDDPSWQWQRDQTLDGLNRWAAAKGTLNDSGTARAFLDLGNNVANQRLGDVWSRAFTTYQGNEGALERAYGMNRQTQSIDPFTAAFNGWTQRGNWYHQRQGTAANTLLGFGDLMSR